jgi:putative methyltransferase (TIGR04325 family)
MMTLKGILLSPSCKSFVDTLERRMPLVRRWHRFEFEQHFARMSKWERLFRGVYESFDEAIKNIPEGRKVGYDNDESATFLGHGGHISPCDYPVLFWLRPLLREGGRVFDFGGYLGISFYSYAKYMAYPETLTWQICDLPAVVRAGVELASHEESHGLSFTTEFAEAAGADVVIASGSLQFVPVPLAELLSTLPQKPEHLLINKTPLYEGPQFVTLNSMGPAISPYWIFNRSHFLQSLEKVGYEVVDSWQNPDLSCYIPYRPDRWVPAYTGAYLKLSGPRRKKVG